jgi:hypothetical protein
MDDDDETVCLKGRDFLNFFAHTRDLEVKVKIAGVYVPAVALFYDPLSDNYVIHLDEDGDDYKAAVAADPMPVLDELGG